MSRHYSRVQAERQGCSSPVAGVSDAEPRAAPAPDAVACGSYWRPSSLCQRRPCPAAQPTSSFVMPDRAPRAFHRFEQAWGSRRAVQAAGPTAAARDVTGRGLRASRVTGRGLIVSGGDDVAIASHVVSIPI
jgi:hypothetical protein